MAVFITTRIVVADDQDAYRIGMCALLSTIPNIEVVGQAANGCDAMATCQRVRPDLVLMDVRMPVMDGIAATRELSRTLPTIKILVLTTFDDHELVRAAIGAGAAGYVLKDTPADDLGELIRITQRGYSAFGPGLVVEPAERAPSLAKNALQIGSMTSRERDVLRELAAGASNKRIASTLGITEGTVRNYVTKILGQLGLTSRTEAALVAHSILEHRSTAAQRRR